MRLAVVPFVVVAAVGCTKRNPAFCEANAECDTGYCNLDLNKCESVADGSPGDAPAGSDANVSPGITVATSGSGTGSVISTPSGINCGAICDAVFPAGTDVTLDAVADDGSILVEWAGACAGFDPCTVTVDGPTNVSARIDLVGEYQWSKNLNVGLEGYAREVAFDGDGNIIVAGHFRGTANFGGKVLTSDALSEDIFVAKLTSSGDHLWSVRFGGSENDTTTGLAIDGNGDVIVAGAIGYSAFGGFFDPVPHDEWMVWHLSGSDGTADWSKAFTVTGAGAVIRGIGADAAGNVLIGGDFTGTINFDDDAQEVSSNSSDVFIAYYGPTGLPVRFQSPDSGGADTLQDARLDASGNAYLGGTFDGAAMYGKPNHGGIDGFVTVLRPSGLVQWSESIGGSGNDRVFAVASGSLGELYAAGHFEDSVDFGDGDIPPAGNADIFLVGYDAAGTLDWATVFGGDDTTLQDFPTDIAASPRGHVVATGALNAPADLGAGSLPSGDGFFTWFAVSVNADTGDHRWSETFPSNGGSDGTLGFSLSTTPRGDTAATGIYTGSVTIGPNTYPAPRGSILLVFGP